MPPVFISSETTMPIPKDEHAALVTEILKEPGQRLVDPTAPRGSEEGDPWVIALAEAICATPPTLLDPQDCCQRSFGARASQATFYGAVWDLLDTLADAGRLVAPHHYPVVVLRDLNEHGRKTPECALAH